jgi:hypothetical protein
MSTFQASPGGDPEPAPHGQFLFGTSGTGLPYTLGPDTRIANIALPDDLQVAVNTTCATPHDASKNVAFFNMQQGDAPVVNSLADQ